MNDPEPSRTSGSGEDQPHSNTADQENKSNLGADAPPANQEVGGETDEHYLASLQFSKREARSSVVTAWLSGVAAGIVAAVASGIAATRPANPLVLSTLPVEPGLTLLAGALAAAIPAHRLGAKWWQSLALGIAGALICLGGVALVYMINLPPPRPDPSLPLRRAVAAEIVGIAVSATLSAKLIRRL